MAKLRNQLKKLSANRLRNQQKLKSEIERLRNQLKNDGKILRNQQKLGGVNRKKVVKFNRNFVKFDFFAR